MTAQKNADGSVTVQFGGCDGSVPNCLPIMPGRPYPQGRLSISSARLMLSSGRAHSA